MRVDIGDWLRENRHESTLLGVCPLSEEVVVATLREAEAAAGFVPMFVATPRQVDADRGYTGWSQTELVAFVEETAASVGYEGEYVVARDHGGPYQSTRDRGNADVPVETAMEYAAELFTRDVRAEFDVLHVDATEDPHTDEPLALDEVARRTAALIDHIETVCEAEGLPKVSYEVGTEEIEGGMTETDDFEGFVERLRSELADRDLDVIDRVLFVVGQVGTTMRLSRENDFDAEKARELLAITDDHDLFLKVHYTDWLPDAELERFPALGIGAANVGPEFAAAIVEELERLEARERRAIEGTGAEPSAFMATIESAAVEDAPWRKFAPSDLGGDRDRFVANHRRDIAICVGRYVLNDSEVAAARETLYGNLREHAGVTDPHERVLASVQAAVHRYVEAFDG